MDILKAITFLALAMATGCDPFAASTPEAPTTSASAYAATASQLPAAMGAVWQGRDASGLSALLGSSARISDGRNPDLDGVGFARCLEAAFRNSEEASFDFRSGSIQEENRFSTTDTVVLTFSYALVRRGALTGKSDTLATQARTSWLVHRANPREWRLDAWMDPSGTRSMASFCGGQP